MTNIGAYLFLALFQLLPGLWLGADLVRTPLVTYQTTLWMMPLSLLLAGLAALPLRETGGRQT